METKEVKACLAVIALLGLTALALLYKVDTRLHDLPGIRMTLPAKAGEWTGTEVLYCHARGCLWSGLASEAGPGRLCPKCGQPLHPASVIESEQLPADTQFATSVYTGPAAESLTVTVVLSGRERESIHRPQRCLVAQGFEILKSRRIRIPMAGRAPLDLMLLDTLRHGPSRGGRAQERPTAFAYWFVGQGRETPYHLTRMFWLAWDRMFRGVAHKWAYIMIYSPNSAGPREFERDLKSLLPSFYPQILR
jgi:hypothetical protein